MPKWVNSTAAAVDKGMVKTPAHMTVNYVDDDDNAIGSIVISPKRISWHAIGSNGTATSYGQAKLAVEKLSSS